MSDVNDLYAFAGVHVSPEDPNTFLNHDGSVFAHIVPCWYNLPDDIRPISIPTEQEGREVANVLYAHARRFRRRIGRHPPSWKDLCSFASSFDAEVYRDPIIAQGLVVDVAKILRDFASKLPSLKFLLRLEMPAYIISIKDGDGSGLDEKESLLHEIGHIIVMRELSHIPSFRSVTGKNSCWLEECCELFASMVLCPVRAGTE